MRIRSLIYLLFVVVMSLPNNCLAQSLTTCDAPSAIAAVRNELIKRGTKDPAWVFRLGLNVPAFRIKDVNFAAEEVRTIGPWRKGTDCEVKMRMTTPVDVLAPNTVIANFRYVVVPGSGGGAEVELY